MAKSLGTFNIVNGGVTLSRRSAGVLLDVSFKELEIWAARNGIDEKKLWQRSYGRALGAIKSKFAKVISRGGGTDGVPKFKSFEKFTKQLRAATNKSTPIGGVLFAIQLRQHAILHLEADFPFLLQGIHGI